MTLTQLDKALRKFVESKEPPVLRGSIPLESCERHIHGVFGGVNDQVTQLPAIRPNLLSQLIGTIVYGHKIKGTTEMK